jgi:hypothetical protein
MPQAETPAHDASDEHLALVEALSCEISSAISAIERNDMSELGARIAAQEVICNRLNEQDPQRLQTALEPYRFAAETPVKSSVIDKIREAHRTLSRLNRTYAGVVSRSHRSIELILSLYQNHGQRYHKDDNARHGKHTLSCEA